LYTRLSCDHCGAAVGGQQKSAVLPVWSPHAKPDPAETSAKVSGGATGEEEEKALDTMGVQ
jgi:hypothetical protein